MIVFVLMDVGIQSTAQIFLTWIGFLHLEINVKKKHMKGDFEIPQVTFICNTDLKSVKEEGCSVF